MLHMYLNMLHTCSRKAIIDRALVRSVAQMYGGQTSSGALVHDQQTATFHNKSSKCYYIFAFCNVPMLVCMGTLACH